MELILQMESVDPKHLHPEAAAASKNEWTKSIRALLFDMADADYRAFAASLIPTIDDRSVIGVRLPQLRRLAQQIARGDWRTFLLTYEDEYFEETMLRGMVIGYIRADIEEVLQFAAQFVPGIQNWSICDSFCAGLKVTRKHRDRVWKFLQPYFLSENEYELRFAVVMLLNYYIDEAYIEEVLKRLNGIRHDGYYVKMAVAWAVSACFVKLPERTLLFLRHNDLDDFTYHKALQKIIDSRQVDERTKTMIRQLKR